MRAPRFRWLLSWLWRHLRRRPRAMRYVEVYHLGTRYRDEGLVGLDLDAVGPILDVAEDWREDGGPATWLEVGPPDTDGYQERLVVGLSIADACRMLRGEIPPPDRPPGGWRCSGWCGREMEAEGQTCPECQEQAARERAEWERIEREERIDP